MLGKPLPYNDQAGVRARLAEVAPSFANVNAVQSPVWLNGEYIKVSQTGWAGGAGWRQQQQAARGSRRGGGGSKERGGWDAPLPPASAAAALLGGGLPSFLAHHDGLPLLLLRPRASLQGVAALASSAAPSSEPLASPIANFYMTDAISRASQTMAKCVLARQA